MNQSRTIAFHTLGCKLNFAETSAIGRALTSSGYQKVEFYENPDVFLINTCSVTENADRECRTIVKRALRINEKAIIVVTGCFAQLKPEAISNIPGVDLVLGASEKFNAAAYLDQLFIKGSTMVKSCEIAEVHHFTPSWSQDERTRVFLKVQDGCDYNCSFCTIPLARGKSRSSSVAEVVDQAAQIVASGAKEIVLTGINLGDFGIDPHSGDRVESFLDLAKALDELHGLERIRISSIEPNLLDEKIIDFIASSEKFVPHFHIPLQSGSDKILKKMRRRYLTKLYRDRIEYIHSKMKNCSVGVDVITGFPGETEEDFTDTYKFLNELNIAYLHVFTYSERDHTLASEMEEIIPVEIRKERNKRLRILSEKKQRHFYESQLGKTLPVLFEGDNKDGYMHGYTPNYVKVKTCFDAALVNSVAHCQLQTIGHGGDVEIEITETITV